ncbi:AI-2E family transporter [Algoriphagus namhaensis]
MKNNLLQQWAYILVIVVFGTVILREGAFLFVPLLWGIFFAFALYPMTSWLEMRRIPRGLAIVLSILFVSLFVVGILYVLFNQVVNLAKDIPEIGEELQSRAKLYLGDVERFFGFQWSQGELGFDWMEIIKPENWSDTLFATGKSLTLGGIIPLYVFLLMYYKDFFIDFLLKVSKGPNERVIQWAEKSGRLIQSYLVGMVKVTLVVGFLSGLYFYFIGSEYFLLFAVLIGILNLIPYVGVLLSSSLAIFFVFLTTDSLIYPVMTLLVLWGIQLLENNIITPLVVGGEVKVNALAVVLAILLGGWLWGVSGMVLFIPLIGVVKLSLEQSEDYEAYAFLLSDEVEVKEERDSFWTLFKRKIRREKPKN